MPYASFVNAAFAYWKPREANRFNAARGAWYAALDVETCIREVAHHMSEFLARSGQIKGVVEYAEMFASMAGEFVDLRQTPDHPCLDPDPAVGYPIGNALADAARAQGLNGIIYPSVRQAGGTCIVASAAARRPVRRARRRLSTGMVRRRGAGGHADFRIAKRYRRGGKPPATTACSFAPSLRLNSSASNWALTASVLSSRGMGH